MRTTDLILAKRYARAFFMKERTDADASRVQADLASAAEALENHVAILSRPFVPTARKYEVLRPLLGDRIGGETRRFLEFLIARRKIYLLPLIAAEVNRLADARAGVVRARVRTAAALGEKEQLGLKTRLERFLGQPVVLDIRQDPDLIGGVAVRMGDWVLDASVRGYLKRLRERFLSG